MILNRQRRVRVAIRSLENFLVRAQKRLRVPSGSVSVALVTPVEIAKWNRAYRGKNRPTDVLSFPSDEAQRKQKRGRKHGKNSARNDAGLFSFTSVASSASSFYLGDVAIAPVVAKQNARRFGRTFDQEMRILILHGMLHLMGYDHETDTGQMERREQRLRREMGLS